MLTQNKDQQKFSRLIDFDESHADCRLFYKAMLPWINLGLHFSNGLPVLLAAVLELIRCSTLCFLDQQTIYVIALYMKVDIVI